MLSLRSQSLNRNRGKVLDITQSFDRMFDKMALQTMVEKIGEGDIEITDEKMHSFLK